MKKKILIFVVLITSLALGGFYYCASYKEAKEAKVRLIMLKKRKAAWERLRINLQNQIKRFRGEAGIVIKDLDTGWEISFNRDKIIPSASLVKIPIMLSYFYAAGEGRVNLKDGIELVRSEKTGGSGLLKNSAAGSFFSIEGLIELMITHSDNTAANMLIDLMGFDTLRSYFDKFGLKNTNLSRKMMDFDDRKKGIENYTTAGEMAYLLEGLYRKQFLNNGESVKCLKLLAQQKINDRIPKKLPEDALVAHKTGLEYGVCHDAGIVFTEKGNFLICVLTRHNNKFAHPAKRFISKIALTAYNYYGNL